jgi:hypothetical protein
LKSFSSFSKSALIFFGFLGAENPVGFWGRIGAATLFSSSLTMVSTCGCGFSFSAATFLCLFFVCMKCIPQDTVQQIAESALV